jgi:hypothetical protein
MKYTTVTILVVSSILVSGTCSEWIAFGNSRYKFLLDIPRNISDASVRLLFLSCKHIRTDYILLLGILENTKQNY